MAEKLITPRVLPADMATLRWHLKLDPADQPHVLDDLIRARYGAACDYAQHATQRAIGLQTRELALDAFPCGAIELPFTPVLSIESITYADQAGTVQTYAQDQYTLDDYSDKHWALPARDTSWPAALDAANAVRVQYRCGYTAETLPDAVKAALLLLLGHLHVNNQAVTQLKQSEIPLGVDALLNTVKVWSM